jgi:hypothetical protein
MATKTYMQERAPFKHYARLGGFHMGICVTDNERLQEIIENDRSISAKIVPEGTVPIAPVSNTKHGMLTTRERLRTPDQKPVLRREPPRHIPTPVPEAIAIQPPEPEESLTATRIIRASREELLAIATGIGVPVSGTEKAYDLRRMIRRHEKI